MQKARKKIGRATGIGAAALALAVGGWVALWGGTARAGDLQDVKKAGVLRHLAIPYASFVSGAGDGFDVELMKKFADHIGVKYEYVKTDWAQIFGDLTGQKVKAKGNDVERLGDVPIKGDVAAAGITVVPWREKVASFSAPTTPTQVWLVARADLPVKPIRHSEDLDKDIAATKEVLSSRSLLGKASTCLDPCLYDLERTGAIVKYFPGALNDMAPAVINGDADMTLLDVQDAVEALEKWPGKIKVIGPMSREQKMSAAFAKSSPELLAAFDAFLESCKKDGTLLKLAEKYYPFVFTYFPNFFKS